MTEFVDQHAAEVHAAAERIRPYIRRTPTLTTDLDPRLRLKAECFQVTGSFKPRGAFNAVLSLMARDRPRGLIAVTPQEPAVLQAPLEGGLEPPPASAVPGVALPMAR